MTPTPVAAEGYYRNPSLSPAILTDEGILYVSGQMPMDADGVVLGVGDIDVQLARVWEQIEAIVRAGGGRLSDIVRINAWTTSQEYVPKIQAKRVELFAGGTPPASALVVVAGLVRPGALVEIDAVAHLRRP